MRSSDLTILIVEDSDEDFDTAAEAIRRTGIAPEVCRATTGDECLTLLRGTASPPAVVLMDLNTPGTDGREALAVIKADVTLRAIPVIVLTTSANPRDVLSCYAAGANAYHTKPLRYPDHLELITALITYWLDRAELPSVNA